MQHMLFSRFSRFRSCSIVVIFVSNTRGVFVCPSLKIWSNSTWMDDDPRVFLCLSSRLF